MRKKTLTAYADVATAGKSTEIAERRKRFDELKMSNAQRKLQQLHRHQLKKAYESDADESEAEFDIIEAPKEE